MLGFLGADNFKGSFFKEIHLLHVCCLLACLFVYLCCSFDCLNIFVCSFDLFLFSWFFVCSFIWLFVCFVLSLYLLICMFDFFYYFLSTEKDLQLQYHNAESMAELIIGQRHSLWISALFRHLNNVLSQCYYTRDKRKSSAVSIGLTWIILCPRNVLNYCFHSPPMDFVNDCTMVVPVPRLDEGGGWC